VTEAPVLAEVVRSDFVESRHRGSVVLLDAAGQVALRAGDVDRQMFPRSANKPMQATGMLQCGLDLDGKLLALAASSHSGEPFHVAGVGEILARVGLTSDALQCPRALPLDEQTQHDFLRSGGVPDRVHMNCSGKHAAMLATCVQAGWPIETYRDPAHPLQAAIRETLADLSAEQIEASGVDGCGAPLFALSLAGVARAVRAMVLASPATAPRMVADAMRAHPDWTSGSRRPERGLMAAVPGLLVKAGAEGVEAFALADGRAGAYKIEDGAGRARGPVTVALLRALGVAGEPGTDNVALTTIASVPVLGGDQPVGRIRATLPF
jgi:L-asparaginase II